MNQQMKQSTSPCGPRLLHFSTIKLVERRGLRNKDAVWGRNELRLGFYDTTSPTLIVRPAAQDRSAWFEAACFARYEKLSEPES